MAARWPRASIPPDASPATPMSALLSASKNATLPARTGAPSAISMSEPVPDPTNASSFAPMGAPTSISTSELVVVPTNAPASALTGGTASEPIGVTISGPANLRSFAQTKKTGIQRYSSSGSADAQTFALLTGVGDDGQCLDACASAMDAIRSSALMAAKRGNTFYKQAR